jgi:hypothetical protein
VWSLLRNTNGIKNAKRARNVSTRKEQVRETGENGIDRRERERGLRRKRGVIGKKEGAEGTVREGKTENEERK